MTGTILIADPVATNRITLRARLSTACYGTATAAGVEDAATSALALAPDLIVADESILAAGLCDALAREGATAAIPVIALCTAARRLAALRAGADAVIERPADEFMLLARIRSLLARGGDAVRPPVAAQAAYGMAEAPTAFEPAPSAAGDPGRLVLVADPPTMIGWRQALAPRTPLSFEATSPERALAEATAGRAGDVYMIAADLAQQGDGLRLLSELRARPASRKAAFVIALPDDRATLAPVALDLGADDVLPLSLRDRAAAEAAALSLWALLGRKRAADQRRDAAERERRWALTDPLTGLANRRHALPRLEAMVAGDWMGELAVMALDLDHFKAVNDGFGHAAGDAVLTEVAARLQHALPEGALAARIGGEEFLVAIPGLAPREAASAAEALRAAIAASPVTLPALIGGGSVTVTASIGLAHGWPSETAELLMLRADRALMAAKAGGRNRVVRAAREVTA